MLCGFFLGFFRSLQVPLEGLAGSGPGSRGGINKVLLIRANDAPEEMFNNLPEKTVIPAAEEASTILGNVVTFSSAAHGPGHWINSDQATANLARTFLSISFSFQREYTDRISKR